jgi:hypothetical protein
MYGFLRTTMAATLAVGVTLCALPASAASYLVNWTGANGYALGGVFSFSDALLGTVITEADLDRLTFDVTLNGTSLGTADLIGPGAVVNFNFDSASGLFLVGGPQNDGSDGQSWNRSLAPVGFLSGVAAQGVTVGTSAISASLIGISSSTLVATRIDVPVGVVPLPAGALLLISGLGGAGLILRRRTARRPVSA